MKLVIPNTLLKTAVAFVEPAANNKSIPILSHLLFQVNDDDIVITASDLEVELSHTISRQADGVEASMNGHFTLPAKKLKSLIKEAPKDALVTLSPKPNSDTEYKMRFSGLRSTYTLVSLPAVDYPNIDLDKAAIQYFSTDAERFVDALETVMPSMANQDVRYYLNGLLLKTQDDKLVLTATDGHRLTQNRVPAALKNDAKQFEGILPRFTTGRLPTVLKGLRGDFEAGMGTNHFHIRVQTPSGTRIMTSQLVDGRFPNIDSAIPKQMAQEIELNRVELVQACRRAAILANEKIRGVRFTFDASTLQIEADNPESESAQEVVDLLNPAQYIDIGFNIDYFSTAIENHGSDTIKIGLNNSNASIVITSEGSPDLLNVIMPMRL